MSRRIRLGFLIGSGLLAMLIALLLGVWLALQYEPKFYREALVVGAAVREKGSAEMLQRLAAMVSDVRRSGKWQAMFTAEQINGWLAVDLINNHPDALPPFMRDPRVGIESDKIVLACRYEGGFFSTVLTLTVKPYVPEENALALRIVSARAGLLPMPLGNVLDGISEAARRSQWRLQWRQMGGDPVALLSTTPPENAGDLEVKIETLRLGQNEIYISGVTKQRN